MFPRNQFQHDGYWRISWFPMDQLVPDGSDGSWWLSWSGVWSGSISKCLEFCFVVFPPAGFLLSLFWSSPQSTFIKVSCSQILRSHVQLARFKGTRSKEEIQRTCSVCRRTWIMFHWLKVEVQIRAEILRSWKTRHSVWLGVHFWSRSLATCFLRICRFQSDTSWVLTRALLGSHQVPIRFSPGTGGVLIRALLGSGQSYRVGPTTICPLCLTSCLWPSERGSTRFLRSSILS